MKKTKEINIEAFEHVRIITTIDLSDYEDEVIEYYEKYISGPREPLLIEISEAYKMQGSSAVIDIVERLISDETGLKVDLLRDLRS